MKLFADMHTHSVISRHAYSTIDENTRYAAQKGLSLLAVTDHAPGMPHTSCHAYFANLHVLPERLHGVRLLRGIELNIMDYDGQVDMDDAILSRLDIAIASLHTPCITPGSKKENTRACIKAMEHPWVDVLGHPGDPRYPMDYDEIFRASKETGCLLEINNASLTPGGYRGGSAEHMEYLLRLCMEEEVPVVVGSDAHFYHAIGEFSLTEQLFEKVDFPASLVLNTQPQRLIKSLKRNRGK